MEEIDELEVLQLHYYLSEHSHSMDAKIYNKVESELLKVFDEVARVLNLEVSIEIQSLEEGGLRAIYTFLNKKKNKRKIVIIGAFFAGIVGTIMADVISDKIKSDPEMEKLKREKIELEIQKLKKELSSDKELEFPENKEEEIVINKEFVDSLAIYISEINKVKISKSKFYGYLLKEGKVEKISTQELDSNFKPKSIEKFVPRKDFNLFVINQAEIDSEYKYEAELEIVSPVLKRSKLNWKAIYNGEQITFSLKDENFKNLITNKNLQFSNGTKIVCELETKRKMNDDGEILTAGRIVYNITKIIYPDGVKIEL
ncbi:MAG: hypothetical protein ACI976_001769 [Aureispira sp.]|jgi:hypothetical protein